MLSGNNILLKKTALILGCDTAIGYSVSTRFAYEGAHVILVGENGERLAELDDKIKKIGGNATLMQLSISSENEIEELSNSLSSSFDKLDILVNASTYYGQPSLIVDCPIEELNKIIFRNITFHLVLLKVFNPFFKISNFGRIILTDIARFHGGRKSLAPYFITRKALSNLIKQYRFENTNTNIKINTVSIENYVDDINIIEKNEELTDLYLWLSMENCLISGRKHYFNLDVPEIK